MSRKIYLIDKVLNRIYEVDEESEIVVGRYMTEDAEKRIKQEGISRVAIEAPADLEKRNLWGSISRKHCILYRFDLDETIKHTEHITIKYIDEDEFSELKVEDRSMHGTYVNEVRIPKGKKVSLKNGDVLGLLPNGEYDLIVKII